MKQVSDGLVRYRFESLNAEGLVHAVFTRLGGVSRGPFSMLNVGNSVGDDEAAVAENHARIYAALGLDVSQVTSAHQVHGNHIVIVTAGDAGRVFPATDGLVTNAPGVALLLRFADCQPILLYDPANRALGLLHAGWRGVAQGMAHRAVETMQAAFGTDSRALIAGLGPAIGPCCYLVGDEVASAMGYALPDWRQVMRREGDLWRFDLPGANAQQLAAAGVQHIEQATMCSACHRDKFYSHRGDNGHTGRFAVIAYLEPRAAQQEGQGDPAVRTTPTTPAAMEPESLNPPGLPTFQEFLKGRPDHVPHRSAETRGLHGVDEGVE